MIVNSSLGLSGKCGQINDGLLLTDLTFLFIFLPAHFKIFFLDRDASKLHQIWSANALSALRTEFATLSALFSINAVQMNVSLSL